MLRDRARPWGFGQMCVLVMQEEEASLPVVLRRRVAQLGSYRMPREHSAARPSSSLCVQLCLLYRRGLAVYGAVAPEDEEGEECHGKQGQ